MISESTSIAVSGLHRLHTKLINFVLALGSALVIAACATTGGGGGAAVVDRAQARWDALLSGDFQNAYAYYSPGYRSSHSLSDFELSMRLRKVQFRGAEFVEDQCEGDACTLKFKVQYHIASPVPGLEAWDSKTTLEEKWVRTDGQWWYFPSD